VTVIRSLYGTPDGRWALDVVTVPDGTRGTAAPRRDDLLLLGDPAGNEGATPAHAEKTLTELLGGASSAQATRYVHSAQAPAEFWRCLVRANFAVAGPPALEGARRSELHIYPYRCPMPGCVAGRIPDGQGGSDRCPHCAGTGLTDDPMGGAERAPRPPGVMPGACGDCAYRQGSPELEEGGAALPERAPFWCHLGLPVSADGRYQPVATYRGLPLGQMVCAGWWALTTGEPLPERPYRERPVTEHEVGAWGDTARANIDRAALRGAGGEAE
jgi:hypothetical protein